MLRWIGRVLRRDENKWARRVMDMDVEGCRLWGRQRKTWIEVVEDMRLRGLVREDANNREK